MTGRSSEALLGLDEGRHRQAALDLGDVDAELPFLAGQLLFQLGELALAAVELVLADLQVDVRADLARLELLLAAGDVVDSLLDEIGRASCRERVCLVV